MADWTAVSRSHGRQTDRRSIAHRAEGVRAYVEGLRTYISAGGGSLVVLFEQDHADEASNRRPRWGRCQRHHCAAQLPSLSEVAIRFVQNCMLRLRFRPKSLFARPMRAPLRCSSGKPYQPSDRIRGAMPSRAAFHKIVSGLVQAVHNDLAAVRRQRALLAGQDGGDVVVRTPGCYRTLA